MGITADIEEARRLLDHAERASDPLTKANATEKAIELLDACLSEDISPTERTLVSNLRHAHARRLLSQLPSLQSVPKDVWLRYFKLFFFDLKDEVARATAGNSDLKQNYDRFVDLWRQQVIDELSRQ